jgi:hypothetical protein
MGVTPVPPVVLTSVPPVALVPLPLADTMPALPPDGTTLAPPTFAVPAPLVSGSGASAPHAVAPDSTGNNSMQLRTGSLSETGRASFIGEFLQKR